jgi:mono/diheme cytochrome c family protein
MRYQATLPSIALALAAGVYAAGAAANQEPMVEAGRRIVAMNCSACHTMKAEGDSPVAAAPPLRTLWERYPDEALTEAFEQGLLTSHPAMPRFTLSREELSAILLYLKSIQEVRGV